MDADKQGLKLFEHRAQFRRDALREENRNARADPEKLDVWNFSHSFEIDVPTENEYSAAIV